MKNSTSFSSIFWRISCWKESWPDLAAPGRADSSRITTISSKVSSFVLYLIPWNLKIAEVSRCLKFRMTVGSYFRLRASLVLLRLAANAENCMAVRNIDFELLWNIPIAWIHKTTVFYLDKFEQSFISTWTPPPDPAGAQKSKCT